MSDLSKAVDIDAQVKTITELLVKSASSYLQGNALEVSALIQEKVISKLPTYIQAPVSLYYPAVSRMALNDIIAFSNLVVSGDAIKAQELARQSMTPDELAKEKESLAQLTLQLASDNYEKQQLGKSILKSALTTALTITLGVI